jgi:hypothetical protein
VAEQQRQRAARRPGRVEVDAVPVALQVTHRAP